MEGRNEGAVVEARKLLRIIGESRFGPPDAQTAAAIEAIDDLARLEDLAARLQAAENWQALLGSRPANARKRRRSP